MPHDARLFLLSLLASITTVWLLVIHMAWLSLTRGLKKRGRRVTYLHHDWRKIKDEISYVSSPDEREKFERWASIVRNTYLVWGLTMITLALLAFFIYN